MRRVRVVQFRALFALAVTGGLQAACAQQAPGDDETAIHVLPVQGNVYMVASAAGNVTVQVGENGVLVVDTLGEALSEELLGAIAEISDLPIRYLVNTHAHPDRVSGNAAVAVAGQSMNFNLDQAAVLAHENVLIAISSMDPPLPDEGWPTTTYYTQRMDFSFNGEAVIILHQPNAHTDGDSIVQFRGSDVISTGEIMDLMAYPVIDVENGGSIGGIIAALNNIIDIAVPLDSQEGGTMVVPGRGRLCDESEVVEYRDMLTIIRDHIQEMIDEGMSLDEVQRARPTYGYDTRYGSDSGPQTPEQFVAAIYRELSG